MEEKNTASNTRQGATQGVTFKTPKKTRDEGNIEGQPQDKTLAREKENDIEMPTKGARETEGKA